MDLRSREFRFTPMTQKEVERLAFIEKEFNQFLRTQGNDAEAYLVAYSPKGAGGRQMAQPETAERTPAHGRRGGPRRGCCS